MLLKTNGSRIRELRQLQGITLAEFADLTGYAYKYVSQIELGRVHAGVRFLRAAADLLGVEIAEITDGLRIPERRAA